MNYSDQWKALSSRIRGLIQAGQLHAHYLVVCSSDTYGRVKHLREQSERVLKTLRSFREQFRNSLPPAALVSINEIVEKTGGLIGDKGGVKSLQQERVWGALVLLAAFETEMSFILADVQEFIRARSERAFSHLQRSIVVDSEFREKWKAAFDEGEVQCEKLGAVHLLLHGIWAFKVIAEGERTDLVFQEPVGDLTNEQSFVDGFVLTEWKIAKSEKEVKKKCEEGRSQAHQYAQGALAGSELTDYRYVVVVSQQHVEIPDNIPEGEVIYRHINIVVDPKPPSQR